MSSDQNSEQKLPPISKEELERRKAIMAAGYKKDPELRALSKQLATQMPRARVK